MHRLEHISAIVMLLGLLLRIGGLLHHLLHILELGPLFFLCVEVLLHVPKLLVKLGAFLICAHRKLVYVVDLRVHDASFGLCNAFFCLSYVVKLIKLLVLPELFIIYSLVTAFIAVAFRVHLKRALHNMRYLGSEISW